MKNSNTISQKIILAISLITVAVCGVLIYSAITNNAFGSEAEANQDTNAQTELSFAVSGFQPGFVPEATIQKNSEAPQPYTLGNKLTFIDAPIVTYSKNYPYCSFSIKAEAGVEYTLNIYQTLDYDIDSITPSDVLKLGEPKKIESNYDFTLNFTTAKEKYTLKVAVNAVGPVQNAKITFYDNNWNFIESKTTDDQGACTFLIEPRYRKGIVVCEKEEYTDGIIFGDEFIVDPDKRVEEATFILSPLENAKLVLDSQNSCHQFFDVYYKEYTQSSPEPPREERFFKKATLSTTKLEIDGEWHVEADGTLVLEKVERGEVTYISIKPVCENGNVLDSWLIDNGVGQKIIYRANEGFEIALGSKLIAEPVYVLAPPVTPEETNSTPQTGDNTMPAVLALGILAAAASVVLISNRRSRGINL